jgi:hypothetical protein
MDPNATLARLIDAAVIGDIEEMLNAVDDLARWLGRGGAKPNDPRKCPDEHKHGW